MHTLTKRLLTDLGWTVYQDRAPTVSDDSTLGIFEGTLWVDTSVSPRNQYVCLSNAAGAASWRCVTNPYASLTPATISNVVNIPVVIPITVGYAELVALGAVTTGSFTLLTLPASYKIVGVDLIQAAATPHFAGPSVTNVTVEVGITGTLAKYMAAHTVLTAGDNIELGGVAGIESATSSTAILLTATSTGADLNVLTAGSCTIAVTVVNPLA
jgi:hypothetical protein